jgi:2,3-bisphosphoglycerate-dependent phosphoglycerate mutase
LTKSGIEDAQIVGIRLKDKQIDVAFHTSLSRSKRTLGEAIKGHKECKKLVEDDRIIERSYGSLAGHSHLQIVKKYGPEQYDKWHRGFNHRLPKGESFADVEKRVGKFIKSLLAFVKKNEVNVAISAHGNSIRLFRKIVEKHSEAVAVTWEIPYDKVFYYCVEINGAKVTIRPA